MNGTITKPQLDTFLRPANSPIARNASRRTSTIVHNSQIPPHAYRNYEAGKFSFNVLEGGTLNLGGVENGNGLLQVMNSSGSAIVTADNDGILIEGGNLVVKNESNTTIIDTAGIVSSANFITDQVSSNSPFSTSGTAYTDITGSTLDSFVLERNTTVLIYALTAGYNVGRAFDSGRNVEVRVLDSVDGAVITYNNNGNWMLASIDFGGEAYSLDVTGEQVGISAYIDMTAGTHTLKLQCRAVESGGNAGTANIASFILNYSILGS